MKTIAG